MNSRLVLNICRLRTICNVSYIGGSNCTLAIVLVVQIETLAEKQVKNVPRLDSLS